MNCPFLLPGIVLAATAGAAAANHEAEVFAPSADPAAQFAVLGIPVQAFAGVSGLGGDTYVVQVDTPPGLGAPAHRHSTEDEIVFVTSGVYQFTLSDRTLEVGAGQVVVMPRGVPHGFANLSDATSSSVWVVSPGESFAAFFQELAALPDGPPDLAKVGAIFARYGIEILPPPT